MTRVGLIRDTSKILIALKSVAARCTLWVAPEAEIELALAHAAKI